MKKSSVLIRRAALFTATVMAVTVAVSLCGAIAGTWIYLNRIAKGPMEPGAAFTPALVCALGSALLGVVLGVLVGKLTLEKMMRPAVEPVARLRDAAVAMADGHLETRADEKVEGELGELGRALNHLSDQLSRNMYTLIVERNRLRNMLNGLSEGIVAINAEGRVTHTNPALGKLIARANVLDGKPVGMSDSMLFTMIRDAYFRMVEKETGYQIGG